MEFSGFSSAYELAQSEDTEDNSSISDPSTITVDIPTPKNLPKLPPNRLLQHSVRPVSQESRKEKAVGYDNTTHQLVELISSYILSNDRVMVVSSGTKSKSRRFAPEMNINSYELFTHFQPPVELMSQALPAIDLYTGSTHKHLVAAIDQLQNNYDVEHRLISPLYGIISPHKRIIPYDCSYLDKPFYIQAKMAIDRNIPFQLQQLILNSSVDVIILALSKSYQIIIDLLSRQAIRHKTVYLLKYNHNTIELQHILL